jgi:hypothetical protein
VINLDATIAWVLREQHRAIDELYSQLIPYGFMPTKSPTWPAMVLSWQLIQMLQLRGLIPDSSQDPDQSETPTAEQLRKEMHDTFDFAASVYVRHDATSTMSRWASRVMDRCEQVLGPDVVRPDRPRSADIDVEK